MIGPGWTVWELAGSDRSPRGGTVIDVFDAPDRDTGEMVTCYRVLDRPAGRPGVVVLQAGQLDAGLCQPPNLMFLGSAVKLLARDVARGDRLTTLQCGQVGDMHRIVAAILQPGPPLGKPRRRGTMGSDLNDRAPATR